MSFLRSFQEHLPSSLWSVVEPEPLARPRLAAVNRDLLAEIGAPLSSLSDQQLLSWLSGETRLEGDQRIATCYAGHQFGVWAGQLGDGRAMSLAEIDNCGSRYEIQVKGLGRTPYSRRGDGRAVIRSSVREYLCAEALHALRIPTTRSLALLVSDTPVQRETVERAAVVARVFPTNVRFGHFEYLYHFDQIAELPRLISYVRDHFMPGFESNESWFREVVRRTARMVAHWQAVGFCHGVMNSDNMSILGITFDYGPFGFMGRFDPSHICNHSDEHGRYSFENQPRIAFWNLQVLAFALRPVLGDEALRAGLAEFEPELSRSYAALMAQKLGIENSKFTLTLVAELLEALEHDRIDYNFFFRTITEYCSGSPDSLAALWRVYPSASAVRNWLARYDQLLNAAPIGGLPESARHEEMRRVNPVFVLRNDIAQEIISQVERDDFALLDRAMRAIKDPFTAPDVPDWWRLPAEPEREAGCVVSCSS